MRGDEYDRKPVAESFKSCLHIKAVQARHLDVQDDAIEALRRHRFDEVNEFLARSESIRLHSQGARELFYRVTNGLIIIHNRNQWFALRGNYLRRDLLNRDLLKPSLFTQFSRNHTQQSTELGSVRKVTISRAA